MDRAEYHIAVKEFSGRLYGYCLKYLQNRDDAGDVVQDVFEKLWENRNKVEFEKAKPWLFTCAHNALLNMIKKNSKISYVDKFPTQESSEVQNKAFEINEVIERCLATLPPIQKSVILLRDLEGYNYNEIGEILGLSEPQVKVYLFRARNKMKKQLKDLALVL